MDNLILIGFMGSGKTSAGSRLACLLDCPLVDTDRLIEEEQGMSISSIFERKGEPAFREMETQCLRKLLAEPGGMVISPGGGLPLREENHGLLRQLGRVVYLRARPETIYDRLKGDTARPLLQTDEPQERIRELLGRRKAVYEKACDYIVDVDGRTVEEVALEIRELLALDGGKG